MGFFKGFFTLMRTANLMKTMKMMRNCNSFVRMHFLYAGIESRLFEALSDPCSFEELQKALHVVQPEFLEAILEVGLAFGELSLRDGKYALKGWRSKAVTGAKGDSLAAMVQASVTYYNSIYRHSAERMRGAPAGNYLDEIGEIVARFGKMMEPFVKKYLTDLLKGKSGVRVLDVGCGAGMLLHSVFEVDPLATGVGLDIDGSVVRQARNNMVEWRVQDRFEIIEGDITGSSLDDAGKFDLIIMSNFIYYFPLDSRPELFRLIGSMLQPEGRLCIVCTMQGNGKDPMAANLNMATISIKGCTPLPELSMLESQLEESGFDNISRDRFLPGSSVYGVSATFRDM